VTAPTSNKEPTSVLYRPVGPEELKLIAESGFRAFPPRLPEQPIFYPVLDEEYAVQIAREWNAKDPKKKAGYVTRFRVRSAFLSRYEVRIVGGRFIRNIGFRRETWRNSIRIWWALSKWLRNFERVKRKAENSPNKGYWFKKNASDLVGGVRV
jgi:hypothetical protein